jgi:hypothetical protein
MKEQARATWVIAKRKLVDTLLAPGLYLVMVIALLFVHVLVGRFVEGVGSGGFDYTTEPLYELIGRTLTTLFGSAFVDKLFAEGPFVLAYHLAFLPFLAYATLSSIARLGSEYAGGVVELVSYGPADSTSFFVSSFLRDVLLTVAFILVLALFSAIASNAYNISLGPRFLHSLVLSLCFALVLHGYGVLSAGLGRSTLGSLGVFLAGIAVLFLVFIAPVTLAMEGLRGVAESLSWVLRWISPFYFWRLAQTGAELGNAVLYAVAIAALLTLSLLSLLLTHRILMYARRAR